MAISPKITTKKQHSASRTAGTHGTVLSDAARASIARAERDVRAGRVREISSLRDILES